MDIHRCRFVDYTPHTITASAFSHAPTTGSNTPNMLRLAIGRSNGDIEIWNPKNAWVHEMTLPGSSGRSIEGLVWLCATGELPRLFSIGGLTFITEWDLTTGRPLINYDCNAGIIWSIDVSRDQESLAVGCDDGSVAIVDISGGPGSLEHGLVCQRQDARVLSLKWCGDDEVVGGCSDGCVRVWTAKKGSEARGRLAATMRVDKSKTESTLVWSIGVLPTKRQIITGDSTGSVKVWDLELHSLLQTFQPHEADVLCLAVDAEEEKFFSAGVDRKIHQFNLIAQKHAAPRWVHNSNRLLHSNDIRAMCLYTSRSHDWLVSGGVERSIVVQSVLDFHHGKYNKITVNQQHSNVAVCQGSLVGPLVVMWQDQQVKIWRVMDGGAYKLVCKMRLAEEENITSCSMSSDAQFLAVARLTSVRVFRLEDRGDKLAVHKVRDPHFDELVAGAKWVHITGRTLLLLTSEEEMYKFTINEDEDTISLEGEIELMEQDTKRVVAHTNCINNVRVSPDGSKVVVSRYNGSIECYGVADGEGALVTRLDEYPHLVTFSSNNTILCSTGSAQIYEFLLDAAALRTPWSRANSANLPDQLHKLAHQGAPEGLFQHDNIVWCYGPHWIAFFDKSLDLPAKREPSHKRTHDGEPVDEDSDDDTEKDSEYDKSYGVISKYRNILKVDAFGDSDIVVFERAHESLPATPTFNLVRFKF